MITNSRLGTITLVACLVAIRPAAASCAPGIQTVPEHLASRAAVFLGRVLEIRQPKTDRQTKATPERTPSGPKVVFDVVKAWKGVHERRLVATDNLIFESGVSVGAQFLVFATREGSDPRLHIMGCGDTKPYSQAAGDLEALGKPEYVPDSHGTS
jgi:hypothetical protein